MTCDPLASEKRVEMHVGSVIDERSGTRDDRIVDRKWARAHSLSAVGAGQEKMARD